MKLTMNVECTPEEARAFLGLPDVGPINALLVEETRKRVEANLELVDPTTLIKNWTAFGGMMADQFMTAMTTAATAATGGAASRTDEDS